MQSTLLFKLAIVLSVLLFFVPKKRKVALALLLQLLIAGCTVSWAILAWQSPVPLTLDLGIPFWSGSPKLIIDKLSAFFVLLINLTTLTGIIYGSGYLQPYLEKKSAVSISIHLWAFLMLQVSMLHVVMMRDGFAFLMAWEMMSVSSFLLVIFEGENEHILKTGISYLVQMHAGFIFLLIGLLWVSNDTGVFSIDGIQLFFGHNPNWPMFMILFIGFAIKAGFVPFHTWLPHAHPAAPSHVSGVMSGVMIKMGIYGFFRVLTFVQADFLIIGIVVMSTAVATGISGIVYASLQHDLKKILAYSSIENIGIIGIGLGISILGKYFNNELFTVLGLVGALMHTLNHALYKPLLFYAAGNVYHATHTRNLNKLGGVVQSMPSTAVLFLVGALAISAIPPLNGFISEFLIYAGVFQSLGQADFKTSMLILATVLTLVILGGLSLYTFTKAFGLTFLGTRRDPKASPPKEVPYLMLIPGAMLIASIIWVATMAPVIVNEIGKVTQVFSYFTGSYDAVVHLLPSLKSISQINTLILAIVGIAYMARFFITKRKAKVNAPTWGCGYAGGDFKHQYTATSYGRYIRELVGPTVDVKEEYHRFGESEIFSGTRQFTTVTKDLVEEKLISKPVSSVVKRLMKIGWAQTGKINHYLVYPLAFLILMGLLTLFGLL